jgi:N6-adenosine-specific RNA methylase IME4
MKIDPAMLADLPFELQAEISENLFRKDWTPSEIDAMRRRCEPFLRAQAKRNQASAGPSSGRGAKRSGAGKFPEPVKGQVRDKIGAFAGVSGRTVEKIAAIVDAAAAEPEKFCRLLENMDRTGRVNGVFRRLKIAKQAELIRAEPPPLPGNGPYRVGVIDVPWPYEIRSEDPSMRGVRPYPTMSIEQICALPVASIMHPDSILWVWVTNLFMRHAYVGLDAWGFQERTILTWNKDRFGTGDWLRGQTEHAIMAVRGKPIVTLTNQSTRLDAPVRGHSVKPVEFYDLVESLCPAPRYADLFSRYRHNERWDCHGDEAPQVAGIGGAP